MTDIFVLNHVEQRFLYSMLLSCCKSDSWVDLLASQRPYLDIDDFLKQSHDIWMSLPEHEWLSIVNKEPVIGDTSSQERKSHSWSGEHAGVSTSSSHTLAQLKLANDQYEKKFGFRYIVCATGKSGDELLKLLQLRLTNSTEQEIKTAAFELAQITRLRLINSLRKSPITTHVLDTSIGRPAENIRVTLSEMQNGEWVEIAQSITNQEGRATTFVPPFKLIAATSYRLASEIKDCFFSPIQNMFHIKSGDEHYHIPVLVSPFGYTAYRGSY